MECADFVLDFEKRGIPYFQPRIVYAPAGATSVWTKEITDSFSSTIRLRAWLSAGTNNTSAALGGDFIGTGRDIETYVRTLPPDHPATGEIVFVTSYTTAAARLLRHFIQRGNERYYISKLSRAECTELGIPHDEYMSRQERARAYLAEGVGERRYELRVRPGLWDTSFWDEVHRLKNMHTQQMYTLLSQRHGRVLMLTASPFMRRLRDLTSILEVVNHTRKRGQHVAGLVGKRSVAEYERLGRELERVGGSYLMADEKTQDRLATLLDPAPYFDLMASFDDAPAVVRKVVPSVLRLIGLRRVTGQPIEAQGQQHLIAANIPPFHCTLVELFRNRWEDRYYTPVHKEKIGEDDQFLVAAAPHAQPAKPIRLRHQLDLATETEARDNFDKRRRLQIATNNVGQENLAKFKIQSNAKDVQKW